MDWLSSLLCHHSMGTQELSAERSKLAEGVNHVLGEREGWLEINRGKGGVC